MRENRLRTMWKAGEAAVNGWLAIPNSFSAETMAHQGWDTLTIDLQHGMVDYQAMIPMLQAISTTATVPVVEVLAPAFPELRILQLDAHPDTREEFLGERYNYASAMARVMDVVAPERVYQVGMRTGAREEYQRKAPHLFPAHRTRPLDAVRSLLPELAAHPLYVTVDVDVLDPSEAPGTGAPEPCGITAAELVEIVRLLAPCSIVGTDLMEVAHAWDPSGRTGITACWILREAILTWWGA